MSASLTVNFHCHTLFSDGELTPEALAAHLAAAGVRFASLTDHDTLEGLPRFQEALKKHGIAFLPGVELTTQFMGREVHMLAYGFSPSHPELLATLASMRQARTLEVHSIAGSLRKAGNSHPHVLHTPLANAAPHGSLELGEAIALVHRAGGRVFLAHPFLLESRLQDLEPLILEFKAKDLDGIEVFYTAFSAQQQADLLQLAQTHHLLVCAGTDFHTNAAGVAYAYQIEFPRPQWIAFRNAVFSHSDYLREPTHRETASASTPPSPAHPAGKAHHFRRRSYILRIFLPTLIAVALFLAAFWGIILPSFEQTLLDRKREMIRELTNSAWSILASYQRDEQAGLLSREQAKSLAVARVEALRYGSESKDYFWIQDTLPSMIMHPYRPDLNGTNVSSFTDSRGVPIFVEFARLVERAGEGYINYVWQWKDDPQRLEPKESFVKGFAPWNWIIGTGLYMDDVNREIARIEQSLINTSLGISGAIILLLMFVLQQSLRIERERQEVVDNLRDSTLRYHTLVEATTEGTLLILNHRCQYANPTFLSLLGYTPRQLEFLELVDLLPQEAGNAGIWEQFQVEHGDAPPSGKALEGYMKRADGSQVECVITLNPIQYADQRGYILLVRDITSQPSAAADEGLALAAQYAPVGIFRAQAARRGVFLELNAACRALLAHRDPLPNEQPCLADLFPEANAFEQFMQTLLTQKEITNHVLHFETSEALVRYVSLSARLVEDDSKPMFISGELRDVTTHRRDQAEREALVDKLQASLLFLHEPLSNLGRDVLTCNMDTSIEQLTRQMTARKLTAALVTSESAVVIGIVTDHDLRARVLAENVNLSAPIHTIMSAPIIKIPEHALIYQALMRMEEKGVRHLGVEDQDGQIVNVIDSKSLIQFQRYAPIVLTREIARANSPEQVAEACQRTVPLAKSLMDTSARPRYVTHMLAATCDSATEQLIRLTMQELGTPPAPFAFISMGSQGRQEQTLLTDQDNGIIYASSADNEVAQAYFLRLGTKVCDSLNRAGYAFCRGGVMANNPRWCRSLEDWISGFNDWVNRSEAQEIIDLSIFFDFRTVYGENALALNLRSHIHSVLRDQPAFFHHLAQNALQFKPPSRLLGNIYLGTGSAEHSGELNLKDAMMPIVSFARLYALREQINHTHTLQRLESLAERGILQASSRDEMTAAYDFLMQLRLQNQLNAAQASKPLSNTFTPARLGYIQRETLKQALAQISAAQKKISYDFLGGS